MQADIVRPCLRSLANSAQLLGELQNLLLLRLVLALTDSYLHLGCDHMVLVVPNMCPSPLPIVCEPHPKPPPTPAPPRQHPPWEKRRRPHSLTAGLRLTLQMLGGHEGEPGVGRLASSLRHCPPRPADHALWWRSHAPQQWPCQKSWA